MSIKRVTISLLAFILSVSAEAQIVQPGGQRGPIIESPKGGVVAPDGEIIRPPNSGRSTSANQTPGGRPDKGVDTGAVQGTVQRHLRDQEGLGPSTGSTHGSEQSKTASQLERLPDEVREVIKRIDEIQNPNRSYTRRDLEELEKTFRTLPIANDPQIMQAVAGLFGRGIQIQRRVDPREIPNTIGRPLPISDVSVSAAAVGLIAAPFNQPTGGWEEQYRRCWSALVGGDGLAHGLDDIVRRLNVEDSSGDPIQSFRQASPADRQAFIAAVRAYDNACLTSFLSPQPPPPELAEVVGFLTQNDLPVCVGILINKDTILTARHCFVHDDGTPISIRRPDNGQIRFYPVQSSTRGYLVTAFVENHANTVQAGALPKRTDTRTDYVFAKIDGSLRGTTLPIGRPDVGDNLVILGVNLYVYMANLAVLGEQMTALTEDQKRTTLIEAARTAIRWDRAPICHVFKQTDACFYHVCQTLTGYSGSPVIRVNQAARRFELAGIHTGTLSSDSRDSCTMHADTVVNVATYISEDVVKAAVAGAWAKLIAERSP